MISQVPKSGPGAPGIGVSGAGGPGSVAFFGIAIFFAAGGEEDACSEDRDYDRDDDKRGSNAHRAGSLLFLE